MAWYSDTQQRYTLYDMAIWPASFIRSMMMSLRKSASDTSEPSLFPSCQTFSAHTSNSTSWVTPRSSVMASYSVRPGDFRLDEGSPPSRCFTTSVVRFNRLTLLTPATYLPSHFTRNLKFLYGSKRFGLTVNSAIFCAPQVASCPAICWMVMTTNSAGFNGANPTMILTIPRSMLDCGLVEESHRTKYACCGVEP